MYSGFKGEKERKKNGGSGRGGGGEGLANAEKGSRQEQESKERDHLHGRTVGLCRFRDPHLHPTVMLSDQVESLFNRISRFFSRFFWWKLQSPVTAFRGKNSPD